MRGVLKFSLASVSGAFCFLLVWLGGGVDMPMHFPFL